SGIGLGMARTFAAEGMNIVLADLDPDKLAEAADDIRGRNVQVMALEVDVTDRAVLRGAAADVARELGPLHLLCNNAGVSGPVTKLHETSDDNWDWAVGVNLMGAVNGLQVFLPGMLAHGEEGHIVNTASIVGVRQYLGKYAMALYMTTKFAMVGLSESLVAEMTDTPIGVSVLCPDQIQTNLFTVGRNRPDKFGGAFDRGDVGGIATLLDEGLSLERIGKRVLDAVRADEFYIFSHPENRAQVEARHKRIADGFDNLDRWLTANPG
ncbi:MAG: SDR family NAD(P)-dependent oxidoreductase, partial [Proteobacteria bacterium]|nr:SDR family NAD(P)-dependent oxidoreductase [Pseudomonadota bacterium]